MASPRVLLATDLSEESRTALVQATAIAKHRRAPLVLFCSCDNADADRTRDALEELAGPARRDGVDASICIAPGPAAQAICAAAADSDADLVVVGTHGHTGFKRLLLGSVAEKVVRRCTRSVLVVRNPLALAGFKNILVATDFSPAADHAVDVAASLAAVAARLEVVHCWQPPFREGFAPEAVQDSGAEIRAVLEAQRERILGRLDNHEVMASFDYFDQPCVEGVLGRLDSLRYDLVALGHSTHLGVHGGFIGSTAEAIVRHAPCSGLVAQSR